MKINLFTVASLIFWVIGSVIIIFSTDGDIIPILSSGIFYLSGYIGKIGEITEEKDLWNH